jgi:hypothetical protein
VLNLHKAGEGIPTMPTNTALVFKYQQETQQMKYPDALSFGTASLGQLIMAFSAENYPFEYTPASIVAQNMLDDFIIPFTIRSAEESQLSETNPEEIQGYIDSITLFIVACLGASNKVPLTLAADGLQEIPGFDELDVDVRVKAKEFLYKHAEWAMRELGSRDCTGFQGFSDKILKRKHFMDKLVERVASQESNVFYQRGSRTARDTLLLHIDVINAFLAGKFRRR